MVPLPEVLDGVQALERVAERLEVRARHARRQQGHRERAPLPLLLEHRLVGFDSYRPETVHPTDIGDPVHVIPCHAKDVVNAGP